MNTTHGQQKSARVNLSERTLNLSLLSLHLMDCKQNEKRCSGCYLWIPIVGRRITDYKIKTKLLKKAGFKLNSGLIIYVVCLWCYSKNKKPCFWNLYPKVRKRHYKYLTRLACSTLTCVYPSGCFFQPCGLLGFWLGYCQTFRVERLSAHHWKNIFILFFPSLTPPSQHVTDWLTSAPCRWLSAAEIMPILLLSVLCLQWSWFHSILGPFYKYITY